MLNQELKSFKELAKPYQKRGITLGIQLATVGFLLRPGAGKTSIMLAILRILQDKKISRRMLVVSTKRSVLDTWPQEPGNWEEFKHLKVHSFHGDGRTNPPSDCDIYCINFENLEWLANSPYMDWFKGEILCVDESTAFKNTMSKRFKLLKTMLKKFSRRYILTGTPAPNGLIDLFGQVYLLDEGASLGRFITHYRNEYFFPTGFGGYEWKLQPGADKRIGAAIAPITVVIDEKEMTALPDLTFAFRLVRLPPKVMAEYVKMEDELVAMVENDLIIAKNAAVASGKCRQLTAGALYVGAGELNPDWKKVKDYAVLHTEKIQAVKELVEELNGESLLILYEFDFEREMYLEALGSRARAISGCSDREASAAIAAFQRGELNVLLGQHASASKSLNLQFNCSNICMPTVSWNEEHYDQGILRVRRQGSKAEKVTLHFIIAKDTIDERVVATVQSKEAVQRGFMSMLKGLRRK